VPPSKARRHSGNSITRPRRTQEERSRSTRDKLLKACVDLLVENGYAQLTTDDVSARAGVTNGARVHHYASKLDLLVATVEQIHLTTMTLGRELLHQAIAPAGDPVGTFIDFCERLYFAKAFLAFNEITIAARTDAELSARLQPYIREYRAFVEGQWVDAIINTGRDRVWARAIILNTINLCRSMATNSLWEDMEEKHREALDAWRQIAHLNPPSPAVPLGVKRKAASAHRS
jgi:AcrR family transcriptional regulator